MTYQFASVVRLVTLALCLMTPAGPGIASTITFLSTPSAGLPDFDLSYFNIRPARRVWPRTAPTQLKLAPQVALLDPPLTVMLESERIQLSWPSKRHRAELQTPLIAANAPVPPPIQGVGRHMDFDIVFQTVDTARGPVLVPRIVPESVDVQSFADVNASQVPLPASFFVLICAFLCLIRLAKKS